MGKTAISLILYIDTLKDSTFFFAGGKVQAIPREKVART
jgi:hypothetical protein